MVDMNTSHITLVCDRTGSMAAVRSDAEGAVNAFIDQQKQLPNPCTMLLIEFDAPGIVGEGQAPWFHVVHDGPLAETPKYSLQPRGNTALFDAIGQAITITGERLAAKPEAERPGRVFVVIQTDGEENSSQDWQFDKLVEAVKRQEQDYSWTFVFLGTGPDAFAQGHAFAGTQMAANVFGGSSTPRGVSSTFGITSDRIRDARAGRPVRGYGGRVDNDGTVNPDEDA